MNIDELLVANQLNGHRMHPWHDVRLVQARSLSAPTVTDFQMDSRQAVMSAADHALITVRRADMTVEVEAPELIPDVEIVHPILSVVGAAVARWTNRTAFHGAAVVIDGDAWILLAPPNGGKSTLASALSQRGHPVLSDDLAVIDGRTVLAGPRSCDLREESARQLARGVLLDRPTGTRFRWRDELAPAPFEVPLAGFFALAWGASPEVQRATTSDALALMNTHEALGRGPSVPDSFLRLLDLPFHLLRRPKDWSSLEASAGLIESTAMG